MKKASLVFSVLLALVLAGCSTSQPAKTTTGHDTNTVSASAEESSGSPADTASATAASDVTSQAWHHLERFEDRGPGLATHTAYQTLLNDRPPKDTVLVAIIDSGIDLEHEDLSAQAWTNSDEVPGNGVDDDNNGYVDDMHGWNFIGGPNGENVNEDTYEITRLYADLRERFADVDSAEVAEENREEYRRFQKIKRVFQEKRRQAEKELKQIREPHDAIMFSEKVLQDHLGTDALTEEAIDSISASDEDVQRARDILQYFYQQNLPPEDVREYYDYLERQVEYNYNPNFDPRPTVGDNYSDKTEKKYGNNDVTGPDAKHGTHVAGIMAATRDNGIGIDGIARGIRVMAVRAVPNGDERDKDIANAIRYAVDNGADVINMSFGKAYSPHKEVVDEAVQHADSSGVLMVHAAGNDGADVDSTDNFPSPNYLEGGEADLWIEVGASSREGGRQLAAPFSNYGAETVDVFAPGQAIYSTTPENEYDQSDGTSMAAPMVTGLAALLMAHYPELSPEEVRTLILETATPYRDVEVNRPGGPGMIPFGELSRTGAIVNAVAALQRAEEMVAAK